MLNKNNNLRSSTLPISGAGLLNCRFFVVQNYHLWVPKEFPMRMIVPPVKDRRVVDRFLSSFFSEYKQVDFKKAIGILCRYYHLKNPRIEWFEYLDWGKTAGKTYENGEIYLVHPENWKRGRKYYSERTWINTVYHEMGHYVFWADAESKADKFACRMVRGLNQQR
jgi:hypothetical protein